MTQSKPQTDHGMGPLAEGAIELMNATAGIAGEQVGEARKRLAAALENGKKLLGHVKDQVVDGAKHTDRAVHKHPYAAMGVAVGMGVLVGVLVMRRWSKSCA